MTEKMKKKYDNLQLDFQEKINSGKLGKLSLSDFKAVADIGKELMKKHEVKTIIKNAADYFSSFGFLVTPDFDGISYIIVEA